MAVVVAAGVTANSSREVFKVGFAESARTGPHQRPASHLRPTRWPGRRPRPAAARRAPISDAGIRFARNLLALVPKSHKDHPEGIEWVAARCAALWIVGRPAGRGGDRQELLCDLTGGS